jgi:hypothetical protein
MALAFGDPIKANKKARRVTTASLFEGIAG